MTRLRRRLVRSPRLMLGVLLALGIGVLPPAAGTVHHRHADGDVAHVHGGRLLGARPALAPTRPAAPGVAAVATPPADGLHDHEMRAVVALHVDVSGPLGVARLVTGVHGAPPAAERAGTRSAGHARAPPLVLST